MAQRVAARLADALDLDPTQVLDPREILELAESTLDEIGPPADPPATGPASDAGADAVGVARIRRIQELQTLESELQLKLRGVSDRLEALERASAIQVSASPAGRDESTSWSLVDQIESRRAQPNVGGLPVLLIEPTSGGSVLDHMDPLSVVALGASTQIVWITNRPEVAQAVADVGDLASVVRV